MPLVYIILVNYNNYQDTIECVCSLQKIKYSNYKIVIVDNNSKDGSIEVLRDNFKKCIIIDTNSNLGFAGGNNLAIRYALENNADYVLLLNNDTVVEKSFLEKLVEVGERYEDVGIVGGKIYYFSEPHKIWYAGGKISKLIGKTKHIDVNEIDLNENNKIFETDYVTGCMMLVSRKAIEKVGMMDENYFLYYEETDWNVRIKNKGFRIMYTPYSIIYHKISSSTKKISYILGGYYDRNQYYFIMKNFNFVNKVCMYCYMRIKLILKLFKAIIKGNTKKVRVIKYTYYCIKNNIMGEMKV